MYPASSSATAFASTVKWSWSISPLAVASMYQSSIWAADMVRRSGQMI
jgi:hypothetical protein